jgi:hypothetical protein
MHAWQGWGWWDHIAFTPGEEPQGLERQASAPVRFAASRPPLSLAQRLLLWADAIERRVRPPRP